MVVLRLDLILKVFPNFNDSVFYQEQYKLGKILY